MNRVFITSLALVAAGCAQTGYRDDIAAKEAAVEELRRTVDPLVSPLLIVDRDIQVFASTSPFVQAIGELAHRPAKDRTLTMHSTGRNGNFWRNGGTWCGSYVELDRSDSMKAKAVLDGLKGSVTADGSLQLATTANTDGHVQVKFQFKGHRTGWPLNACPPGGGIGSSIGVNFTKSIDIKLAVGFKQAQDGRSLTYSAFFVSPHEVNVTASVGLGPIGSIGIPMKFDLPKNPIATGTIPLLLASEGTFTLPATAGKRPYAFALKPVAFSATQQGIRAAWKGEVKFKPLIVAGTQ